MLECCSDAPLGRLPDGGGTHFHHMLPICHSPGQRTHMHSIVPYGLYQNAWTSLDLYRFNNQNDTKMVKMDHLSSCLWSCLWSCFSQFALNFIIVSSFSLLSHHIFIISVSFCSLIFGLSAFPGGLCYKMAKMGRNSWTRSAPLLALRHRSS